MSSQKLFILFFSIIYTAITGSYVAGKWIDASDYRRNIYIALLVLVNLAALIAVFYFNRNKLVQCFVFLCVSSSLIYAVAALLSQDFRSLILPAFSVIAFVLLPNMREWISKGAKTES